MKTNSNFLLLLICCLQVSVYSQTDTSWLKDRNRLFEAAVSPHFHIYSYRHYLDSTQVNAVMKEREISYKAIKKYLKVKQDVTINIYLFPDEKIKYAVTGHKGIGWAFDNHIVEVFNDSIRVDPYHEMVHILVYQVSRPPAMIDEGFAVYFSEKLGNNAFAKLLSQPGKSVDDILTILLKNEKPIPLETLLSYEDIGESDHVALAYCESASFVKFLIEAFGRKKILRLMKAATYNQFENNKTQFKKIYHSDLETLERKWLEKLHLQ